MSQPPDTAPLACLDAGAIEAEDKPCCHRMPGPTWCLLPDGHIGEHHGVGIREWPGAPVSYEKGRKPR